MEKLWAANPSLQIWPAGGSYWVSNPAIARNLLTSPKAIEGTVIQFLMNGILDTGTCRILNSGEFLFTVRTLHTIS